MLARLTEALQEKPLDLLNNNYFGKYGITLSKVPFLVKLRTEKGPHCSYFHDNFGKIIRIDFLEHLQVTASVLSLMGSLY